ncbi:MAG TPA: hypothetical protein G4O00_13600 [Thermoflexia bacterium]|nr:hypothetical protein [Thermoflexia bacterium]
MEEMIQFPNGWSARLIRVSSETSIPCLLAALDPESFRALVVLSGGAGGMSHEEMKSVRPLLVDGLAQLATQERIAILDGGTNSGVMALLGEGVAHHGLTAPVIGVCPAAAVTWPGNPNPRAVAELEPHHSHFVLTPGERFGAETKFLYALADALGERVPSLTLVVNGGRVTLEEVLHSAHQGRPIVVLKGSGRAADVIATAWEKGESDDPLVDEILRWGDIALFDVGKGPENLKTFIRRKLWEECNG